LRWRRWWRRWRGGGGEEEVVPGFALDEQHVMGLVELAMGTTATAGRLLVRPRRLSLWRRLIGVIGAIGAIGATGMDIGLATAALITVLV